MLDDMRIPDYPTPIRAFRIWRATLEVDQLELMEAVTLHFLGFSRGIVPTLEMLRPDPVLASWNMGLPWGRGWNAGKCIIEQHDAPQYDCSCGHYAVPDLGLIFGGEVRVEPHRTIDERYFVNISVPGVVEMRGRIIEHEKGYRAEYARPVALLDASRWSPWLTHCGPMFELITSLYGITLTPHVGLLDDFVKRSNEFPNLTSEPNDDARMLVGGPGHGTVLNAPGSPVTLNVPTFERVDDPDEDGYPTMVPVNATYDRIGNCSYRYRKEGR